MRIGVLTDRGVRIKCPNYSDAEESEAPPQKQINLMASEGTSVRSFQSF